MCFAHESQCPQCGAEVVDGVCQTCGWYKDWRTSGITGLGNVMSDFDLYTTTTIVPKDTERQLFL